MRNYKVIATSIGLASVFLFVSNSYATGINREFYKGINTIFVHVTARNTTSDSTQGKPENQQLLATVDGTKKYLIEMLNSEIKTPNKIEVSAVDAISNVQDIKGNPNAIFIDLEVVYWKASNISPELNQDIAVVSVKYIRSVTHSLGIAGTEERIEERKVPHLLVGITPGSSNVIGFLNESLKSTVMNLIPYINCSNGGSCKELYK